MTFATDEEIKIAHDILLKGKKPFDVSRIDIIKENNSCYVQASPGSGKTTTLLAKLIILANKMPLPDGKGVCVLTHTNVAIDEIKASLDKRQMCFLDIQISLELSRPFFTNMLQRLLYIIFMGVR